MGVIRSQYPDYSDVIFTVRPIDKNENLIGPDAMDDSHTIILKT